MRYQIRQFAFTILALSQFVLQMKVAIFNVFSGIIWFVLPVGLVAINDTAALAFGKLLGRKLFASNLVSLSPKKTWEGFIGAAVTTILAGFYLPLLLQSRRLLCSFAELQTHGDKQLDEWTCNAQSLVEIQQWSFLSFVSLIFAFSRHD
mgnify:CR=1 FL=1